MNTRNESRSSDVRENNMREDQWTFEEPNALEVPDSVKARFDAEGMAYRWIRISVTKGHGADPSQPTTRIQQQIWFTRQCMAHRLSGTWASIQTVVSCHQWTTTMTSCGDLNLSTWFHLCASEFYFDIGHFHDT